MGRLDALGCVVGGGDLLADVAELLGAHGHRLDAASFYTGILRATTVPLADVLAVVERVRSLGVYCALATNQDPVRLAFMLDELGYRPRFDAIYASCDLGVRKPVRDYFEAVIDAVALPAETVLFLDDHPDNVAAARDAGLRAEQIAAPADVSAALRAHEILA